MLDRKHALLMQLAEECMELSTELTTLGVRISKALRFGIDEIQPGQGLSNAQRITQELADVLALAESLRDAGVIHLSQLARKKTKVENYLAFSYAQGMLSLSEGEPEPTDNVRQTAHRLYNLLHDNDGISEIDWVNRAIPIMRGDK